VSIEYQRLKAPLRTSKIESNARGTPQVFWLKLRVWAGRIVDVGSLKPREQIVELDRADHHVLEELADFEMRRM
jgi:hypothetical protein